MVVRRLGFFFSTLLLLSLLSSTSSDAAEEYSEDWTSFQPPNSSPAASSPSNDEEYAPEFLGTLPDVEVCEEFTSLWSTYLFSPYSDTSGDCVSELIEAGEVRFEDSIILNAQCKDAGGSLQAYRVSSPCPEYSGSFDYKFHCCSLTELKEPKESESEILDEQCESIFGSEYESKGFEDGDSAREIENSFDTSYQDSDLHVLEWIQDELGSCSGLGAIIPESYQIQEFCSESPSIGGEDSNTCIAYVRAELLCCEVRDETNVTPTPTPTPTPTAEATPTPTYSPSPTPESTANPTPEFSPTPVPSPTPNETPTQTPYPSPTGSISPTPSPTISPEPSPSYSPTPIPTETPYPSPSPSPSPRVSPSASPVPTPSPTSTPEPSPSYSPTPTPMYSPTPTSSPTPYSTPLPSPSPSTTPNPTPTSTPKPTTPPLPDIYYQGLDDQGSCGQDGSTICTGSSCNVLSDSVSLSPYYFGDDVVLGIDHARLRKNGVRRVSAYTVNSKYSGHGYNEGRVLNRDYFELFDYAGYHADKIGLNKDDARAITNSFRRDFPEAPQSVLTELEAFCWYATRASWEDTTDEGDRSFVQLLSVDIEPEMGVAVRNELKFTFEYNAPKIIFCYEMCPDCANQDTSYAQNHIRGQIISANRNVGVPTELSAANYYRAQYQNRIGIGDHDVGEVPNLQFRNVQRAPFRVLAKVTGFYDHPLNSIPTRVRERNECEEDYVGCNRCSVFNGVYTLAGTGGAWGTYRSGGRLSLGVSRGSIENGIYGLYRSSSILPTYEGYPNIERERGWTLRMEDSKGLLSVVTYLADEYESTPSFSEKVNFRGWERRMPQATDGAWGVQPNLFHSYCDVSNVEVELVVDEHFSTLSSLKGLSYCEDSQGYSSVFNHNRQECEETRRPWYYRDGSGAIQEMPFEDAWEPDPRLPYLH